MSTDNKRELLIAEIPRLRRYAIALLRDRIAADDLVQDVVLRALDRLHLWRDGTNMRTWLFTIMHNLHANDMRRLSRTADNLPLDAAALSRGTPPEQEAAVELSQLADAVARLPTEPWATQARYVPGQVYAPVGVNRNDVNPRPLSRFACHTRRRH